MLGAACRRALTVWSGLRLSTSPGARSGATLLLSMMKKDVRVSCGAAGRAEKRACRFHGRSAFAPGCARRAIQAPLAPEAGQTAGKTIKQRFDSQDWAQLRHNSTHARCAFAARRGPARGRAAAPRRRRGQPPTPMPSPITQLHVSHPITAVASPPAPASLVVKRDAIPFG